MPWVRLEPACCRGNLVWHIREDDGTHWRIRHNSQLKVRWPDQSVTVEKILVYAPEHAIDEEYAIDLIYRGVTLLVLVDPRDLEFDEHEIRSIPPCAEETEIRSITPYAKPIEGGAQ